MERDVRSLPRRNENFSRPQRSLGSFQSEAYLEGMKTSKSPPPDLGSVRLSEAYLEGMKTGSRLMSITIYILSEAYLEGMKTFYIFILMLP